MTTPLRLDDLGASSKLYERHRGKWWKYPEVTPDDIGDLARWSLVNSASMTLAITACWVERDGSLTPYHVKYPEQAATVHYWATRGVFEIACHGLTHCVPGRHLPSWLPWKGNRQWHREFIDAVPFTTQVEHLRRAKQTLEDRFLTTVTTLVPPGNAISERLAMYALEHGFERVTCRARGRHFIQDDTHHAVIHDAEIVALGVPGVMDHLPTREYRALNACVTHWKSSPKP